MMLSRGTVEANSLSPSPSRGIACTKPVRRVGATVSADRRPGANGMMVRVGA
jgi:hypothetical protein